MKYTLEEAREIPMPSNGRLHTWLRRDRIPFKMAQNALLHDKKRRANSRPYNMDLAFLYGRVA